MAVKPICKGLIKIINNFIDMALLIIMLFLTAITIYALWDSEQVFKAANAKQYEIYKPDKEQIASFHDLQNINPDVIAWLTVYGTHIDYPITQGSNNMEYIHTNVYGEYAPSGSIFLDSNNNRDFSNFNNLLYGHHMEKQAMFGELDEFSDDQFFEKHQYGDFFYNGKSHGLEFFAFIHTDAYDGLLFNPDIKDQYSQQVYLDMLFDNAITKRNIQLDTNDRILLLTTCSSSSTNGRDVLAAKIVDRVYANPFGREVKEHIKIDAYSEYWDYVQYRIKLVIPIVIVLLLVLFINLKKHRKPFS